MPKFEVNDWVQHRQTGVRGTVKGHRGHSTRVRWVGHSKSATVGTRSLKSSGPPRAFVLEGSLDRQLESLRSAEHLLRNWLDSLSISIAYKNVHTLGDVAVLARPLAQNPPPFIHISCHGAHDKQGRAFVRFAPSRGKSDRIYLDDRATITVFRNAFAGMALLFDACLLGRYGSQLKRFRMAARLSAVAAFTRDVYDHEAMLFDLLLYQGMMVNGWTFHAAVHKACTALKSFEVLGARGPGQRMVRVF